MPHDDAPTPADPSQATRSTTTTASVAVLAAIAVLLGAAWLWGGESVGAPGAPTREVTADPVSARSDVDAEERQSPLVVLRRWDRARAAAWAAGDTSALADLYVDGAAAGERDVAMLQRWLDRGLRVRRMQRQVLAVDVRRATASRLVLRVTDRLASATAVRVEDGARWRLPADRTQTRRVVLRREAQRWRVAASYDRPLATTAAASGSDMS